MTEEQYCLQRLAELRKDYELNCKPYIERLTKIRAMSPVAPLVLPIDQAREFIELTMGTKAES